VRVRSLRSMWGAAFALGYTPENGRFDPDTITGD
jgi:hypothetical protein